MMAALAVALTTACHPVDSGRILARDLAAVAPAFATAPPEAMIGYAPLPGATRVFTVAELERLARRYGADEKGLTSACFERRTAPLDPEAVAAAMRAALEAPSAQIEIVEFSRRAVPPGQLVFPREGLTPPPSERETAVWNGYVSFDGGRFSVWARVRIRVKVARVIAVSDLKPGEPVDAAQVRLDQSEAFPWRRASATLEGVVGRIPRHLVPAGAEVTADAIQPPFDVTRGDKVAVEVRGAASLLKLGARAEAS